MCNSRNMRFQIEEILPLTPFKLSSGQDKILLNCFKKEHPDFSACIQAGIPASHFNKLQHSRYFLQVSLKFHKHGFYRYVTSKPP